MKIIPHIGKLQSWVGLKMADILPQQILSALVSRIMGCNPQIVLEAVGPYVSRGRNLDNMPFDLATEGHLQFEHLPGLFASTSLDHAVISMTIRQGAYLYGLVRQMKARKVIEIGRYKGGSTLLIAAAMRGEGEFWSVDIGEKEVRLHRHEGSRSFDEQLADVCRRFGLKVGVLVGNSRTIEIDTGEVDMGLIDGDHSYSSVKNDFERFGRRARVGGAVLFDDAFDEGIFRTHSDTVGRIVQEIVAEGEFKLVNVVNRMAHLERVRPVIL